MGKSLNFLQYHLHYKTEYVLKIVLLGGQEDSWQRWWWERNRACGTSSLQRVCLCMAHLSCQCGESAEGGLPQQLCTSSSPGLDFEPLFHKCLKAGFIPFFPLNKHYMVVINTSSHDGQGFKIDNNFHKNTKNEKICFKKFAVQTKWQLLKISIK